MNAYTLEYVFDKKKPLKIALLAVAIGVDIVNLALLISAIGGDYIKLAYLAAGIVLCVALRVPTLKMTYSVKYVFKDGLSVYRIYPHKKEMIFCLCGNFEIVSCENPEEMLKTHNAKILYSYRQDIPVYLIRTEDGAEYALALDDYMLALILSFYGKELRESCVDTQ